MHRYSSLVYCAGDLKDENQETLYHQINRSEYTTREPAILPIHNMYNTVEATGEQSYKHNVINESDIALYDTISEARTSEGTFKRSTQEARATGEYSMPQELDTDIVVRHYEFDTAGLTSRHDGTRNHEYEVLEKTKLDTLEYPTKEVTDNIDYPQEINDSNMEHTEDLSGGSLKDAQGINDSNMEHAQEMNGGNMEHAQGMNGGNMEHTQGINGGNMEHTQGMNGGNMEHAQGINGNMEHSQEIHSGNIDELEK